MTTMAQPMTAEDLANMPDDGFRYELVRGELMKMPPAGHIHGKLAASILASLGMHVKARGLGTVYAAETGFHLASDPDHVRAPDAAFVRRERADAARDVRGFFPGPPDAAVEVISPSDRYSEVEEKVEDWLQAGTLVVIVVDPRRRVVEVRRSHAESVDSRLRGNDVDRGGNDGGEVRRSHAESVMLTEADTLDIEDIAPGWRMPIEDIFE